MVGGSRKRAKQVPAQMLVTQMGVELPVNLLLRGVQGDSGGSLARPGSPMSSKAQVTFLLRHLHMQSVSYQILERRETRSISNRKPSSVLNTLDGPTWWVPVSLGRSPLSQRTAVHPQSQPQGVTGEA